MQPEPALLSMKKHAHQAPGLIAKNPRRSCVNVALDELKAIYDLLLRRPTTTAIHESTNELQALWCGQQRQALFQGAIDDVDVARMGVHLVHELLQPAAR